MYRKSECHFRCDQKSLLFLSLDCRRIVLQVSNVCMIENAERREYVGLYWSKLCGRAESNDVKILTRYNMNK